MATVSILLAAAAFVGVGLVSLALPTVVMCALLTLASLTWFSPLGLTRVALIVLFVPLFLAVLPQLKPDQVNYGAFYALAVIPVAVVICSTARPFHFDSGAVLLVAILVSALVTLLSHEALATGYGHLLWPLTTLAVYLLVLNSPENGHAWLLTAILAFSLVEALLGISQSFLQWPVFSLAVPAIAETDRGLLGYVLPGFSRMVSNGSGTFQHFNGLGSLLALSLPISFGWLLESPRSLRRLLPFALLAVGLITSYSRGGWIAATIGCLFVYWTWRPRRSRSLTPLLLAGVLLFAVLLAPYVTAYYSATQNVSSRVATWHYAFAYWIERAERIPFGLGFGSFQQTILAQQIPLDSQTLATLHSSFLQILLEIGIAGFLLFAWFLITTIRPYVVDRRPSWQSWALGGILAFVVSQIVDNSFFGIGGTCVFALAACLRRADARHDRG